MGDSQQIRQRSDFGIFPFDIWKYILQNNDCVLLVFSRLNKKFREVFNKRLDRFVVYELQRRANSFIIRVIKPIYDRRGKVKTPPKMCCNGIKVAEYFCDHSIRDPVYLEELLRQHTSCVLAIAKSRGWKNDSLLLALARAIFSICPHYIIHKHASHLFRVLKQYDNKISFPLVINRIDLIRTQLDALIVRMTTWLDERQRLIDRKEEANKAALERHKKYLEEKNNRKDNESWWVYREARRGESQRQLKEKKERRLEQRSYAKRYYRLHRIRDD